MKINKNFLKVIILVLILLIFGLIICNNTFAWDVKTTLNGLEQQAESKANDNAGKTVTNIMGAAINLVSTIGAGVAIIMLIVIGIQYVSTGADGKAEAKKDLVGYVYGAVILFGVSGILKILQMFIDANINKV